MKYRTRGEYGYFRFKRKLLPADAQIKRYSVNLQKIKTNCNKPRYKRVYSLYLQNIGYARA